MPTIESALREFASALNSNLTTHEFERFLAGNKTLTSHDLGNQPEPWTEHNLIWPILEAVELKKDPQPYGAGDRPDFELLNVDVDVLGENKSPNKIENAKDDIKEYLRDKALGADHGIATDGIDWVVYKIELGGDFVQFPEIERVSLRRALTGVANDMGIVSGIEDIDIESEIEAFTDVFEREAFNTLLTEEVPQRLRDERKRDVEAFYDLYIELLFGAGKTHDYDTTLMDDVVAPHGASKKDERVFAITLVNRLLFIKFLEEQNVLHDGFLLNRVETYEDMSDKFAGSLYDTQIRPLFYELLNTDEDDRASKYQDEDRWFSNVPYLNGGLFQSNVDREGEFRVRDRILPTIISDLIEGTALDTSNGNGIDPAIIGSVFEKTINHLEQERDQRDIGAYYTPNDVTALITQQTVDPKIKEELLNAYGDAVSLDADEFKAANEDKELEEILRDIEDGAGWFGNPDATREALDRLSEMTVIDPACGSGHFLTTALDEIHRVQISLLRGLHGEDPDPGRVYDAKKELALNSIYGVDIEPVGVEIAKLRVWLKIIEDGYQDGFGKLPNIDVNIAAGNSLIGLPITGVRTGTLDMLEYRDRIRDVVDLRLDYKYEDAKESDKREMRQILDEELRPQLDDLYLQQQNYTVETEINNVAEFDALINSITDQHLYPTIESVKAKPEDGESITNTQEAQLEEYGFSVYSKSARLDINDREREIRNGSGSSNRGQVVEELRDVLESGFVFEEVTRQPVAADLDTAQGPPFHWIAEFPEVADIDNMTVDFDIILGNPPYGDILEGSDAVLTSGYVTGGINDISAQFVERQLQLLDDGGYFGNITTLRLVYQSDIQELHDRIRRVLEEARMACFGSRPSRVFDNADIKTAIMTGKKGGEDDGTIQTSNAIIFSDSDRKQKFNAIEYGAAEGLVLRDRIGGTEGSRAILPKVGGGTKRSILEHLRENSEIIFDDVFDRDESFGEYNIYRRRGVRYWINTMYDELYSASEVEPMYFESELHRDAGFIIMNSSLFYLYWLSYGDFHHLNWSHVRPFPFPEDDVLEAHADEIEALREVFWEGMQEQFDEDQGLTGEFHMAPLKPVVDEIDDLVGKLYGLADKEIEFTKNYLSDGEYGRSGPEEEEVIVEY